MFILSSVFSGLEYWSIKDTSIYENSESFWKYKIIGWNVQ